MTEQPASAGQGDAAPWGRDLLLLGLFFGLLYFFMLGGFPLANPDEGRYAEIPREMLASGDWVLPKLNDVVYFEKPPLVYWTTAISFSLFGQNEWAARGVAAFFALFGVLLTYAAGRGLYGRTAGFVAALVLGSSFLYFALARILILDMAVSVLMAGSLFMFALGVREQPGPRRRLFFYGLYVLAALATLAKGLIGVLLPGAVMFFWLLLFNRWASLRPFYLPTGSLLFLAVAAPWHVLAAQRNSEWANFYFVHEHWLRFTTTEHNRDKPFWFFIPILIVGVFPWTGYFLSALFSSLKGAWAQRKERAGAWFLVVWVAFIFLFFSKSHSKLIPYILPVFPALAVLLGAWFVRVWVAETPRKMRLGFSVFFGGCAVLALACLVLAVKPTLVRESESVAAARLWLIFGAFVLIAGLAVVWEISRRVRPLTLLFAQVCVVSAFYLCVVGAYPQFHKRSSKELAATYAELAQPGEELVHWRGFAHDFLFYAKTFTGLVDTIDELEVEIDPKARASGRFMTDVEFQKRWRGEKRMWVVVRDSQFRELSAKPGFGYHLIASNRRYLLLSNQP